MEENSPFKYFIRRSGFAPVQLGQAHNIQNEGCIGRNAINLELIVIWGHFLWDLGYLISIH